MGGNDYRAPGLGSPGLPADYWLAKSSDGGRTWSATRLAGSFDLTASKAG
ncbi:hypothetical protein [Fodinicola feengrottensis]|nr:hypothetical protein [Fodinicola feengrottensis]